MRLIDPKMSIDTIKSYIEVWDCKGCLPYGGTQHNVMAVDDLQYLPTIEAEPVRHGEWVETEPDEDDRKIGIEFSIKCSRCHDENSHLDFNENHEITGKTFWKSRFCPNCGAKMDGGTKI